MCTAAHESLPNHTYHLKKLASHYVWRGAVLLRIPLRMSNPKCKKNVNYFYEGYIPLFKQLMQRFLVPMNVKITLTSSSALNIPILSKNTFKTKFYLNDSIAVQF
jgi:hypothetical protein